MPPDVVEARRRRRRNLIDGALLYGAVALGGILGSLLRWALWHVIPWSPGDLPWPTIAANVAGSFVIGFYAGLTGPDGRLFVGPRMRQAVLTGFCGGLTTFSVFSLETMMLASSGELRRAGVYVLGALAASLVAVWAGDVMAAGLNRLRRS